jgi:transposase
VKRLVAQELILSFVPETEQRLWRTVTRKKQQLTCDKVRLQNQLECLLEEAHIKLSSLVSDLLGVSARRMLEALADGETNPEALAALADRRLRATARQLCDALGACEQLNQVYRRLLKMALEELKLLEELQDQLDKMIWELLALHQDAVRRVAEIPDLGVDSAHQVIAEVGPRAVVFPSANNLASWVGICPGEQQSADQSQSSRSPKGNCAMRRILNQAAHAAVKVKGSIFEVVFCRLKARLEYQEAIWAIAHRICRLIWKILHDNVRYEERGPEVSAKSKQTRTAKMIRRLRALGYQVEPTNLPAGSPA